MKMFSLVPLSAAVVLFATNVPQTRAHCDTLDGPVVMDAQKALAASDVKLVLHWVQQADESEIQQAFERALAVRKLTPQAKELADRYFFETLVRVHRAGEGAPFTGLKAPGTGITPAIAAADKALETEDVSAVIKTLEAKVNEGVHARFKDAVLKRKFKPGDVAAGREYVEAYVQYVHYAEGIYAAAEMGSELHSKTGESHEAAGHVQTESHGKKIHGH